MFLSMLVAAAVGVSGSDASGVEVIRGNEISPSQPQQASVSTGLNPRAIDLVDSDPAIRSWAVQMYDRNRNGWLTLYEAQPAVAGFQDIADADRDGHVTVTEYRAAVDFLRVRF